MGTGAARLLVRVRCVGRVRVGGQEGRGALSGSRPVGALDDWGQVDGQASRRQVAACALPEWPYLQLCQAVIERCHPSVKGQAHAHQTASLAVYLICRERCD
jgi:hypothetical protein